MQITKRGIPKKERIWKGTCQDCDSEAEAIEREMTHITHDTRDGSRFSWEICPVCKAGSKNEGYGGMLFYPETK